MSPSDIRRPLAERYQWLVLPLVVFATSRGLLLGFSRAAPLFSRLFSPDPAADTPWASAHPVWAALAHGEIGDHVRIAKSGYATLADAPHFPLLGWAARAFLHVGGAIEGWLLGLSMLACAVGFIGVYRVFETLRGSAAASWGLFLLAAFPFAYHLSDGSALAALLAFSSWAVWLGLRGRWLVGAVVLSLGVLAHPACVAAVMMAAGLRSGLTPWNWRRGVYAVLPLLVLGAWLSHLRMHFWPGLWLALWPGVSPLMSPWLIMVTVFGGGLVLGIVIMLFERELRVLALTAAGQMVMVLWAWTPHAVHGLAACWPAFLIWGDLLTRWKGARIPALAILATHQGLLLLCFVRYLFFA